MEEYKELLRERHGGNPVEVADPDDSLIAIMEQEVEDWKADKVRRKQQNEESDKYIKDNKLEAGAVPGLVRKTSIQGSNPKTLELMAQIKDIYGEGSIDYEAADNLLTAAGGKMEDAIELYNNEAIVKVTVIYGPVSFQEQFNARQKGEELQKFLRVKLNVQGDKQMVIRNQSKTAVPLKDYDLRTKTLGELGFRGEALVFVEVV